MDYEYIFAHLTIILTLAATAGILVGKLKQPIMIGYIIAGVLIGPSCFGLVASQEQVHFYSELGILLLLFVIGMELNIKSFLKMWKIPTLFTVIQVVGSAILAVVLSHVFKFPVYIALLTAFFTCLSSTAAIVKVLEYLGESKTDVGHITIGILVAQDIVVVPMMLIIRECGKPLGMSIVLELAFAVGLVVFILKYLGKKDQITLPTNHLIPNNELIPVVTLSAVFIAATLVTLFGLSEAYGAFLAGLFIGNTQARQSVLNNIKPIQNVLLMVFFLSVGLMFDLKFLFQNWFIVLISLVLVTTWKIFFNSVILKMFSIELAKATSIGIILAQLGEFSLVLATVAVQSGIIGVYGQKLIVCITALSLSISPLFILLSKRTRNLSFTGDNSAQSIIRVIFSGRCSKLVAVLIHRSKNIIKQGIDKIRANKFNNIPVAVNNISCNNETTENNIDSNINNTESKLENTTNTSEVKSCIIRGDDSINKNNVLQNEDINSLTNSNINQALDNKEHITNLEAIAQTNHVADNLINDKIEMTSQQSILTNPVDANDITGQSNHETNTIEQTIDNNTAVKNVTVRLNDANSIDEQLELEHNNDVEQSMDDSTNSNTTENVANSINIQLEGDTVSKNISSDKDMSEIDSLNSNQKESQQSVSKQSKKTRRFFRKK